MPDLPPLRVPNRVRPCGALKVLHDLKTVAPERYKALMVAMKNPHETDVGISKHLRQWEIRLSDTIIRRHRTARCSCGVQLIPERMEKYEYK